MATMYSEYDQRAFFSAPQLTRVRHRYRGPRESWKINLEISQMTYAIHRLYEQYNNAQANYHTVLGNLLEGASLDGVGSPTLTMEGVSDLVRRLSNLRNRVKALEA